MKAYTVSDRNGDEGITLVVFAETAGKAKAYAANSAEFDYYEFTDMRAQRVPALDRFYRGRPQMDWMDDEDRVAMVRYAGFSCSYNVDHPDCDGCPAYEWCEKGGQHEV